MLEYLEYYSSDGHEHRFFHWHGDINNEFVNIIVKRVNKIGVDVENYCLWGIFDVPTETINPMFLHSSLVMEKEYQKIKNTMVLKAAK